MKKRWIVKKLLAVMTAAAVLGCIAPGSAFAAAPQYRVTELSVPTDAGNEFANKGLVVGSGGKLDAFSVLWEGEEENRAPKALLHHQSVDGGKSWSKVDDTSWLAEYAKKYNTPGDQYNSPDYFVPDGFYGNGDGNFYFSANAGEKVHESAEYSGKSPISRLYKLSGGKVSEVTVLSGEEEPPLVNESVGGICKEGLTSVSRVRLGRTKYMFRLRDPATGKVTYEHVFNGMIPWGCGGGMVYGINVASVSQVDDNPPEIVGRETDKRLWLGYNMAQGKETLKMVNPVDHIDEENGEIFFNATADDGACWFAASEGLFRLEPGAASLTKIMDAAQAGFSGGRTYSLLIAGKQKDAYALTCYYNEKNPDDPKNFTQTKLLHYTLA